MADLKTRARSCHEKSFRVPRRSGLPVQRVLVHFPRVVFNSRLEDSPPDSLCVDGHKPRRVVGGLLRLRRLRDENLRGVARVNEGDPAHVTGVDCADLS